jgi:hypothetical protein
MKFGRAPATTTNFIIHLPESSYLFAIGQNSPVDPAMIRAPQDSLPRGSIVRRW